MMKQAIVIAVGLATAGSAGAGTLSVAYTSMERMVVKHYLAEGGRRYLRGGPDDTCAYAFIQEPRIRAEGDRLVIRFLFAGRAGTEVAGKCVGAGDNFDIVVSGVPRATDGAVFLDEVVFEADHTLFGLFSPLIRSQIEPLLTFRALPPLNSYIGQLSAAGAGTVELRSLQVGSIDLKVNSAVLEAEFLVTVAP